MAKPFDPRLLELERYPYLIDIATRFADMDVNGHINNVAMAAVFEDARARFDFTHCMHDSRGVVMTVATYIDYTAQAHYPHPLTMAVGVSSIGKSSWVISGLALQDDVTRAVCRATMVNTDGTRPKALSEGMREMLASVQMHFPQPQS